MPRVVYIQPDDSRREVEATVGVSLMKNAVTHGVPGIVAECGGSLMCATCHVYVAEGDADRLPPISEDEDEMLEVTAAPRRTTSRLSCQIVVDEGLEGLTVHVPGTQG